MEHRLLVFFLQKAQTKQLDSDFSGEALRFVLAPKAEFPQWESFALFFGACVRAEFRTNSRRVALLLLQNALFMRAYVGNPMSNSY